MALGGAIGVAALFASLLYSGVSLDRGLRDEPIAGDSVMYLTGDGLGELGNKWTAAAAHSGLIVPALVPGDLLSDLQLAGEIGDPWYELNWLKFSSMWANETWTYSTTFALPEAMLAGLANGGSVQLVFDGIKMGAKISLDGQELGEATSQFARYVFDIRGTLLQGVRAGGGWHYHTLEVSFDPAMLVDGRFMACTGGWDWAAYSDTEQAGVKTLTKGIWKHVYLVATAPASASLSHVVPQIYYRGSYPTTPLADGEHGGFRVDVRVFLSAQAATAGTLLLDTAWGEKASMKIDVPAGESVQTLSVDASAEAVKLWWPAGMGGQPLYNIDISFRPGTGTGLVSVRRRIGFRYFALVTGNDTDPAYVSRAAAEEGTESHGMFFRVNGAAIWSRGANMIPMEQLEGRMSDEAHRLLVRSAFDAGMNTLRVWGGGIFLPDSWYDTCDELGLLVYHDMQYAQSGHAPASTTTQEAELRHQIRRLSAHPSIVIWDGCNECTVDMHSGTSIYATFVLTVVVEEDKSRAVWPSCPAYGWAAGVHKLDCLPNGNALVTPSGGRQIEIHGPYLHGSGFPAVNGAAKLQPFNPGTFQVVPTSTGTQFLNTYVSEFGAVAMSSFESMAPTLAPEHWALHAGQPSDKCSGVETGSTCTGDNVMAQRNYPCDNFIVSYFGARPDTYFNTTGEAVFKKQLYQCMLAQALHMKTDIERRRSQNQLGTLVWQFNEIWPTGGWGSVEYGAAVPGQVLGGRWKPLHYLYLRSLFADVMATCGGGGKCYVKNDAHRPFEGSCDIEALNFFTGERKTIHSLTFEGSSALAAGPATMQLFNIDLSEIDAKSYLLTARCATADSPPRTLSANEFTLAPPVGLALPDAVVSARIASEHNADGSVDIELTTDKTALYVTLSTLAQGRFSDNVFAMSPGQSIVRFVPFGTAQADIAILRSSLRIEHLQPNLFDAPGDSVIFA